MSSAFDYNNHLIFNPEGKIKQLEYIKKTSELGNISLALGNKKFGVLITHTPPRTKLAEKQQKAFEINDKTLFTFSGITNDGLSIVKYLKSKSVYENVIKDRELHPVAAFESLCTDAAIQTLNGGHRIYGVMGILMTDYDGIKIVEFDPSGYAKEVKGSCVGNNCQSCITILEEEHSSIDGASEDELINLGLKALQNAFADPEENDLKGEDVTIFVMETGKKIKSFHWNK